ETRSEWEEGKRNHAERSRDSADLRVPPQAGIRRPQRDTELRDRERAVGPEPSVRPAVGSRRARVEPLLDEGEAPAHLLVTWRRAGRGRTQGKREQLQRENGRAWAHRGSLSIPERVAHG